MSNHSFAINLPPFQTFTSPHAKASAPRFFRSNWVHVDSLIYLLPNLHPKEETRLALQSRAIVVHVRTGRGCRSGFHVLCACVNMPRSQATLQWRFHRPCTSEPKRVYKARTCSRKEQSIQTRQKYQLILSITVIRNMESSNTFHELSHLSPEDQIHISRFGRGPAVKVPYATVHEAFESIVDSYPEVVAARLEDRQITYSELDVAANRLANYLIEAGLKPRQRICLVVHRSFEMLVGIFAILKAGCQYVPVDGGVASEQTLRHILKDTEARFVLCLPKFQEKIKKCSEIEIAMVVLGQGNEDLSSKEKPKVPVFPEDGIYAIYTSGKSIIPE